MELSDEPFGRVSGRMVRASAGQCLLDLPVEPLKKLFADAGAVCLRGFGADATTMKKFADRFSTHFNRDRLRPTVEGSDGFIQRVLEGKGYAEAHAEQANSPFRPDAVWFCCTTPAESGGETLFWDGIQVFDNLDAKTRAAFAGRKLRFFQRYGPERWQMFLGPGSTLNDVRAALDGREGVSYFVNKDESLYLEYVAPAVVKTRWGDRDAFANSLLTERANTLGELMTFHDGTAITDDLVASVRATMDGVEEEIPWEAGDLVFIDNSRFMHGRNPYTDDRRLISSCLSFLNF